MIDLPAILDLKNFQKGMLAAMEADRRRRLETTTLAIYCAINPLKGEDKTQLAVAMARKFLQEYDQETRK